MPFNSIPFALFLPCVLAGYHLLGRRAQNGLLILASGVFYGWWDWRFLGLLVAPALVDYVAAIRIEDATASGRRRAWLALSVGIHVGLLGFFKYFGFFVTSFHDALATIGLHASMPTLQILLPVGISFYTFQSMSYTLDVYRGDVQARRSLPTVLLFATYFPVLLAGPISRPAALLPQLERERRVGGTHVQEAFVLILWGLFKKVAVADTLAPLVDVRFQFPWLVSGADLVWALYLFSIQIYCDFSGYSDIARGVSRLFGIDLALNFRQPYFASSIADFWRRWHISLSTWFRDYLFPAAPQRPKRSRWMRPMTVRRIRHVRRVLTTFLVSGLWHGANWAFVVWGGLHGLYVAVQSLAGDVLPRRRLDGGTPAPSRLRSLLAIVATFHLVTFTWLFFRTGSLAGAWNYLAALGRWQAVDSIAPLNVLGVRLPLLLATLLAGEILQERTNSQTPVLNWSWLPQGVAYAYLVVAILVLGNPSGDVPFIYFRF